MSVGIRICLRRLSARPPLVALADVTLKYTEGEVTIRRCAVFDKTGQAPWATLPRITFEKHGKRTYVPAIDLPWDLKKRVLEMLLVEHARQHD
jgi:hypothetical protein